MDIERQRVFAQCELWGEAKTAHLLSIPLAITSAHDQDLMREWLAAQAAKRRMQDLAMQVRAVALSESQLKIAKRALIVSLVAIVISIVALFRSS